MSALFFIKQFTTFIFSWGKLENGTWTNVFGMLENGTIDMLATVMTETIERIQFFDFAYPISFEDRFFVIGTGEVFSSQKENISFVAESDITGSMLLVFRVFSLTTWLIIMTALFATSALMVSARVLFGTFRYKNPLSVLPVYGTALWRNLRIMLEQADDSLEATRFPVVFSSYKQSFLPQITHTLNEHGVYCFRHDYDLHSWALQITTRWPSPPSAHEASIREHDRGDRLAHGRQSETDTAARRIQEFTTTGRRTLFTRG